MDEVVRLLEEVAQAGAPAQRDRATELLNALSTTQSENAREEALLLIDAFRNDPYLWR